MLCFRRGVFISRFIFKRLSEDTKNRIIKDVLCKQEDKKFCVQLLYEKLFLFPQYRNVFYYRIKKDDKYSQDIILKILTKLLSAFLPEVCSVELATENDLGGGLYLPHRYCVVSAKEIGENVTILQGVTIGKDIKGNKPIIGNNVKIFANAIIYGGIEIGDNSWIGAGAVVNYDVPCNSTIRCQPSECKHITT